MNDIDVLRTVSESCVDRMRDLESEMQSLNKEYENKKQEIMADMVEARKKQTWAHEKIESIQTPKKTKQSRQHTLQTPRVLTPANA